MDPLPDWEAGTPAVLAVAGPHAIPISTAVRRGDFRVVFALGRRRDTLARIVEDPAAALTVLGAGVAFTAYGRARVIREELDAAPVAAIELSVDLVQDHLADGRTEMVDGARWRWIDAKAAESDPRIRAELGAL
ncbi:MAG: hypothetical protein QOJ07_3693 [Thermoleophilaceae bacterium]|jgi:hypothetical protein|nr:hypothetical protein [Thermoleophilaceae bacterium]